jgi:hypothetical protein
MGGSNATRSVAEGASGIVWLAAEALNEKQEIFFEIEKSFPGDKGSDK